MLLRKEKNWSQTDLAKQVGVSREIISKYEKEDVTPSVEVARKIADALNVSLDYLVGKTNKYGFFKDSDMIRRLKDISELLEKVKEHILYNLDATLRDYKAGQVYAK